MLGAAVQIDKCSQVDSGQGLFTSTAVRCLLTPVHLQLLLLPLLPANLHPACMLP